MEVAQNPVFIEVNAQSNGYPYTPVTVKSPKDVVLSPKSDAGVSQPIDVQPIQEYFRFQMNMNTFYTKIILVLLLLAIICLCYAVSVVVIDELGAGSEQVIVTDSPTLYPTLLPSSSPSILPTFLPSVVPTLRPSPIPSFRPTSEPSRVPTSFPTEDDCFLGPFLC